ncbi:hypothetical protein LTR97_006400 [Elasticomyces elasticus]|uniref:Uncharacterized protein n=1 Tax=Elasticomyces elasticus TaxID=574655 RepID=A0AAN7W9S7_9PEZI|nr:hypothetical protein LTR97_006400 [Elasticomyces elasticus]
MRLLDTHTLELHEFTQPPAYAILSHRWSNEEVTYEDYSLMQRAARRSTSKDLDEQISEIRSRPGLKKIEECCRYSQHAISWLKVLTACCIDKRSSAEVSEASDDN